MPEPVRVALSFIGIIIIIAGAYYATYYIGLKSSGVARSRNKNRNRNIALLENFAISKDKSFCIVEIAGKIYVIGVTNQSMTLLDTLEAESFADLPAERNNAAAHGIIPGGVYGGKIVNKLASFMAQRMGRPYGTAEDPGTRGETFADSMKIAREGKISVQPDRDKADMPDGSEVEK